MLNGLNQVDSRWSERSGKARKVKTVKLEFVCRTDRKLRSRAVAYGQGCILSGEFF